MNNNISASAFRVNFRRVFGLVMWQGFLFLSIFSITIVVLLTLHVPVYADVAVLLFVLVADTTVLVYQVRQIFNDSNEIPTQLTLMDGILQEKVTDDDEIRMIPFANIKGFSLGQAEYPEIQNFFRIRLKNTNDEVYMTTAETSKQEFFLFTEQFVKQIENYNKMILPGMAKIKQLK